MVGRTIHRPLGARSLGGEEARGGIRHDTLAKPWISLVRASRDVLNPWRGGRFFGAGWNPRRGPASETAYGVACGKRPRGENPKSGTGMKQAWEVARGARRREGEKP
jgi:hypothetical protein